VRRIRPQVVITFGLAGGNGHPDHIAISCQFTAAALVRSGSCSFTDPSGQPVHSVLGYIICSQLRQNTSFTSSILATW